MCYNVSRLFLNCHFTYHCTLNAPAASVLLVSEEMIELGSAGIFSIAYLDHPYSQGVRELAAQIVDPA